MLFTIALLFLVIELFSPGFGVMGILGAVSFVAAVISAAFDPVFGLFSVMIAFVITGIGVIIAIKVFGARGRWKKLVLEDVQKNQKGYVANQVKSELSRGSAYPLRALIAQIDGKRHDVVSEGRMIPAGTTVQVVQVRGVRVVVRQKS